MRTRRNPFTGELEDDPPPRTFLCPQHSRPDRQTVSEALGFTAPLPFSQLAEWIYDQANGDPYRCVKIFGEFVGLSATDGSARYDSTPCELFPFGATGVDGDHYGYLVHAPELETDDYPVCHYCPMDSDGVIVAGSDTFTGLASAITTWGNPELRPNQCEWNSAFNDAINKGIQDDIAVSSAIAVPTDWTFLPSSDGVGVLALTRLFGAPPIAIDPYGPAATFVDAADAAINEGYPATALYYLREGYWFKWTEHPIELCDRICDVYERLGRPSLAAIMRARVDAWRNYA